MLKLDPGDGARTEYLRGNQGSVRQTGMQQDSFSGHHSLGVVTTPSDSFDFMSFCHFSHQDTRDRINTVHVVGLVSLNNHGVHALIISLALPDRYKKVLGSEPRPSYTRRMILPPSPLEVDDALDHIFLKVDTLCAGGHFSELDAELAAIVVDGLSTDILVGLLASTFPARAHLPSRPALFERIRAWLTKVDPSRTEGLLKGLA